MIKNTTEDSQAIVHAFINRKSNINDIKIQSWREFMTEVPWCSFAEGDGEE